MSLLHNWFRSLIAFDQTPTKTEFSIVDPSSAEQPGVETVVLAIDASGPTILASLFYKNSGVKLFEKQFNDGSEAQNVVSLMSNDLSEAQQMAKEGKLNEGLQLSKNLLAKYSEKTDTLVQPQAPVTNTQANQEPLQYKGFKLEKLEDGRWQASQDVLAFRGDSIDVVKAKVDNMLRKAYGKKLVKSAEIVMQNLFFSTPDEALEYQEKMKKLQGPETGEGQPLWEQMNGEEKVAPSNESTEPEEDTELAPPSLSFDRIERDKAKTDKDIGKRIKDQVKTEVESALEQKSASVFGPDQEELVEALRKNGRNWDEVKKILVKDFNYNEDDTTVFLDSIRQKEEGGSPEGLPLPPKPPEDLVSPQTHDKLVKEIEDKTEPKPELKPEPTPLADEIARADNAEIRKVAARTKKYCDKCKKVTTWTETPDSSTYCDECETEASLSKKALNPLQEPPAVGQTPGQPLAAPVEEAPTFDSPVPPSQDTNPEPEFLEAPQEGDRVYVMGDYETGEDGYEGTMVSEYTSKGDQYAVISKDDGDNAEVALHRVVKASQKKVAQVYYEKKAHEDYPEDSAWGPDHSVSPSTCSCGETIKTKNQGLAHFRKHHGKGKESALKCPKCGEEIWDVAGGGFTGAKLNKCWNCGTAFDSPEQEVEVESDLDVEGKANQDVIRMFVDNSFPKDKMPVWGTTNLKITKYPNGWALVNYQTPILYRANGSDVVVFNTKKYSVTTSKIQSQIRGSFAGQPVKETDEAGIYSAIDQSNLSAPEPEVNPELQSLHESALKIKAELEREGEIAIYFHKEGIEKKASDDSAFEGNGWCRVWIQDIEIESDKRYPEILKLADENVRITALKDLARELAHEALRDADSAAGKFGVQAWFESLEPSRHDRIDWVSLASPKSEEEEDLEFEREQLRKYGPEAVHPDFREQVNKPESSQDSKMDKQAADPVPPAEGPKEVPTTFKKHLKAPPATEREKAAPATTEQAQLVKEVESSLGSLEAIKSLVDQAKAKLNAEIKAIEERGGRVQIEGELKEKIEKLSKMVEAVQNQMIYAGDTMVRLVQETKERPFKPSEKWKIEKLMERLSKYEDAAKYLKQAEDGAQHLATSEDIRELYFFPRKMSKLHKSAGFLETLDSVYNSVMQALKLIVGSEQEQPTAV